MQTDGFVTADKVKNAYLGLGVKQDTFLTLFAKHNQEFSLYRVNGTCNAILKKIGKQCGIKTRLTYHVSRHTFGTLLTISQGVPIETISRMMGHAKITKEKISQDMEALSHKLKGLEMQIIERM